MSVRERLTAVPLQRFIILKTALCCSTGGYFFMFSILTSSAIIDSTHDTIAHIAAKILMHNNLTKKVNGASI